jgi:16S rRNA A1518/A1519 N6-dimethyltransferase RsmA/KsgA/DIM1 with predicted DNA glycosylase/AP lyase activity
MGEIPRTAFRPRPKVDSVLLRLRRKTIADEVDPDLFGWLVRELFTQRKRLVRGAIKHALSRKFGSKLSEVIVQRIRIPDSRVFQLSAKGFESLTRQLEDSLTYNSIGWGGIMQDPRKAGHKSNVD